MGCKWSQVQILSPRYVFRVCSEVIISTDKFRISGESSGVNIGEAVLFNEALRLRSDIVSSIRRYFGLDRIESPFDTGIDSAFVLRIIEYQSRHSGIFREGRMCINGVLDGATRYLLESEVFAGVDESAGVEGEVLIRAVHGYDRCREIIEGTGGFFDSGSGFANILAIRGARISGCGDVVMGKTDDWGYDSVIAVNWREGSGVGQSVFFSGSTAPGSSWYGGGGDFDGTAHLRDGQYVYKGGGHGTREVDHVREIVAICREASVFSVLRPELIRGEAMCYDEFLRCIAVAPEFICYRGLVKEAPIEVYREFRSDSGPGYKSIPDSREVLLSRKVICNAAPGMEILRGLFGSGLGDEALIALWYERMGYVGYSDFESGVLFGVESRVVDEVWRSYERAQIFYKVHLRYRDIMGNIGINIHSGSARHRFSVGCQNIPLDDYPRFIDLLDRIYGGDFTDRRVLYTLMDGSRISGWDSRV